MWPSARHQYGLRSQFGSPEFLDPREGKNVGLLFSSGRFSHLSPSSLSIHGRHDPPLSWWEQRARWKGRKFLVSVEVGGMVPTVPWSGRKRKTEQPGVINLIGED